MAKTYTMMPRDKHNEPIPILGVYRSRKISATSTSAASALPLSSTGNSPGVITVIATGNVIVVLGTSGATAADYSSGLATGCPVLGGYGFAVVDLPVADADTHIAVITATVGGARADCEVYVLARE
mgnify:CR=1 FL=1